MSDSVIILIKFFAYFVKVIFPFVCEDRGEFIYVEWKQKIMLEFFGSLRFFY